MEHAEALVVAGLGRDARIVDQRIDRPALEPAIDLGDEMLTALGASQIGDDVVRPVRVAAAFGQPLAGSLKSSCISVCAVAGAATLAASASASARSGRNGVIMGSSTAPCRLQRSTRRGAAFSAAARGV